MPENVLPHISPLWREPALFQPQPLSKIHPSADHAHRIALEPVGGGVKRAIDVFLSGTALLLLALPFALIALAIALDSPGPILFRQRRGGFRGKPFKIFKFRTMRVTEDSRDLRQARRGDARVTRLGALLRRTSIDELPQLINVFLGDMSLVGPRPHAIVHDNDFARTDYRYRRRQLARPGITGLAQVSGARGATETEAAVQRRLDLDLSYISNWSVLLDFWLMLKTASAVLVDRNAY